MRAGFDVERVTKRFYERFKAEHAAFLKFLQGIPDEGMQRWYASVMLNRLMFIYFIQKKGFLDGDPDYLRTRLAASQRPRPTASTPTSSARCSSKGLPGGRTSARLQRTGCWARCPI